MCFKTKQKSWYKTNCTIDGKEEILFLDEDDLRQAFVDATIKQGEYLGLTFSDDELRQIYLSDGDQSGYLLPGNYCEKISKEELQIETETQELGSCSYCGGTIVADAETTSYKGKVIQHHYPSWGVCWDCGAI